MPFDFAANPDLGVVQKVRALFGTDGRYWGKGALSHVDENGATHFCLVGAYLEASGLRASAAASNETPVIKAMIAEAPAIVNGRYSGQWAGGVADFNDARLTEFVDIKAFLDRVERRLMGG